MPKLSYLKNKIINFFTKYLTFAIILLALPNKLFAQSNLFSPENQVANSGDAISIIYRILSIFLGIAGLFLLIYLLYGTYNFVSSQGEEHEVEQSKTIIIMSIVGILIVLIGYAFIEILFN